MTQRPRIPSGNRVLLVLLGIACGMGLIWYSLLSMARAVLGGGPEPAQSLAQVTALTRFNFPPGSVLIDGEVCRCWYSHAFARVSLPPEQVTAIWRQRVFTTPPKPARDETDFFGMEGARIINRWKLWKVKDYRYNAGGEFDHGGAVEALVSLDDPAHPILYFYWWTG